ncbi:MAG TPA: acyl-CoA dehydrogenase family protein [Dehalococcoidia bacterium]|nr:acyl-CoA dehydrogenase family protein [Dehalococcoidia bacterium]
MNDLSTRAGLTVQAARELIDLIGSRLARGAERGGRVSIEALDERQIAVYDYAYLATELAAAEEFLRYLDRVGGSTGGQVGIEVDLAVTFIADMAHDVRTRVSQRPTDFEVDDEDVRRLLDTPEVRAFIAEASRGDRYGRIVRTINETQNFGDPGLDEAHLIIRDNFRHFGEEVVAPQAEAIHREDLLVPEEIIQGLAELGCFGLSVPERYGGIEDDEHPDNIGMVVVTEELSRASLAAAGSLITRPEILSKALLKGGTEEQKQKWLPIIAAGEKMVAISVTEPDFGSDVAAIKVSASKVDGGWLLNGAKMWTTFGGRAEILMVLARTNPDPAAGHRGLSAFIVEKPAFAGHTFDYTQPGGGRISGRAIATIGYRGMHSFEVSFENYLVPDENLIGGDGGRGQGFYLQMQGFAGGRLQTAGRAVGVMQAAFEMALAYANDRKVFGRPILNYQLTEYKLARMAAIIQVARQFSYQAGRLMGQGQGQMEASMAKLFASRMAEWVTREAMQIHGGMGYAEESAVSRYFVDARVLSIFEGTEEILALRVIAKTLLDQELAKVTTGAVQSPRSKV